MAGATTFSKNETLQETEEQHTSAQRLDVERHAPAPSYVSRQVHAKQYERVGSSDVESAPSEGASTSSAMPAEAKRFIPLQQWEGVVTEVGEESFWAETHDLTHSENPVEVVELPLADLPREDRDMLQPGSVFYWIVGYEDSRGGQRRRSSEICLKRGPTWTRAKLERVQENAQHLFREMCGDGSD